MTQRTTENQNLHDRIIGEVLKMLNQKEYDIYSNPGDEKKAGILDNYPDIIMTSKGDKTVKFILEIETTDTINQTEAAEQWKKFSTEIKATFYLIVPESAAYKAKELSQQFGINARFGTYSIDINNQLTFNIK